MSATAEITIDRINVAGVDRIRATITKDGSAWNLSSGSVVATFHPPTGSSFDRTMTAESAAGGIFYYDTAVADITVVGWWRVSIKVTDGTVVKVYPYKIGFKAVDQR